MNKLEEIKKKVSQDGIYINRVPKKTKKEFIDYAKEEFAGDYGMALKWLIDFRSGLLSNPNQILMDQMQVMSEELDELKSNPEKKTKVIRSLSGKVITEQEE